MPKVSPRHREGDPRTAVDGGGRCGIDVRSLTVIIQPSGSHHGEFLAAIERGGAISARVKCLAVESRAGALDNLACSHSTRSQNWRRP
jgi:hypothetical protein